jgi:hypothetical protein
VQILDWLLDSDPAIRWQVLRDLTDADDAEVAAERARVATTGWGAELLALQDDHGRWDGGTYRPGWAAEDRPFFDAWSATHFVLRTLTELGLPPESAEARRAVGLVREHVRWEQGDQPYFEGEVEPCINGLALANGAYFGERVGGIAERLVADRLADGGWNCWAEYGATVSSFHSTLCALEGLLAWERAGGGTAASRAARRSGEEYLLERGLFRRRSDGAVPDPRFTMPSFPTRWRYDVLWALDHLRAAGPERDPRCEEAVELIRSKRRPEGFWVQENAHPGPDLLELDAGDGFPSRWITLRALRVLRWWDRDTASRGA